MDIRPMNGQILVETEDDSEKLSCGLFRPEGAIEDIHIWGRVIAVGSGKITTKGIEIPVDVKVGDKVYFIRFLRNTKSGESLIKVLGPNRFLINEKDIVLVEEV
jgi:chaperonin GroES